MSQIFKDIEVGLDEELEEKLSWLVPNYSSYHILKKSVDARKGRKPVHFVYSVEVFADGEVPQTESQMLETIPYKGAPPLIIGSGPAGLFAALRFVERGIPCHLFERGSECGPRLLAISKFWRYGQLSTENNVCFGEGGAGLFSDGKLITRIKSPYISYVMNRLVRFGAPEEIKYLANPHVGSDRIRRVIPKMREYLKQNGCTIHFDTKVTELLCHGSSITGLKTAKGESFSADHIILACGHSAEDFFSHLQQLGVYMEGKSFAIGLRIEHPQNLINQIQYREMASHPKLSAANYRLTFNDKKSQTGVYSFCMCPGGYVLSSGTSPQGVVSNGMSNYNRNSPFANAAIVVTVDHSSNFAQDAFGGLKFRQDLELRAWKMVQDGGGNKELPAQRVVDFLEKNVSEVPKSSCPSGVIPARLDKLVSPKIYQHLCQALYKFEKNMHGFISPDALLHGVESRTSCPVRIKRDPHTLISISHSGLYPTGEGAGYAGGITSAACDGIKVAEAIVETMKSRFSQ